MTNVFLDFLPYLQNSSLKGCPGKEQRKDAQERNRTRVWKDAQERSRILQLQSTSRHVKMYRKTLLHAHNVWSDVDSSAALTPFSDIDSSATCFEVTPTLRKYKMSEQLSSCMSEFCACNWNQHALFSPAIMKYAKTLHVDPFSKSGKFSGFQQNT